MFFQTYYQCENFHGLLTYMCVYIFLNTILCVMRETASPSDFPSLCIYIFIYAHAHTHIHRYSHHSVVTRDLAHVWLLTSLLNFVLCMKYYKHTENTRHLCSTQRCNWYFYIVFKPKDSMWAYQSFSLRTIPSDHPWYWILTYIYTKFLPCSFPF